MRVQISSKVDTNTYDAGSKSQVSMPQGELADQSVGWDGPWFVVRRRASRGPQMIYKYRLLKNDQLETQLNWSGDSPLAGMKVHRIYDRTLEPPPPPGFLALAPEYTEAQTIPRLLYLHCERFRPT